MVACLERTEGNADFHQIVDFLNASTISLSYAVSGLFLRMFSGLGTGGFRGVSGMGVETGGDVGGGGGVCILIRGWQPGRDAGGLGWVVEGLCGHGRYSSVYVRSPYEGFWCEALSILQEYDDPKVGVRGLPHTATCLTWQAVQE
ncbi:hypothetical protein Tco_0774181 [Tanacetum coccineum]|uniref:Uncharacterized protein n=1 Tax=Tanacetum coccineum TaxID=301880 RepID=A0ABQ4ZMV9_9ASTR